MFENDERFIALEREKERRDLFDDHLDELKQKVLTLDLKLHSNTY